MAANDITDDIIEQILIRSDVKDVMRCRGVCKSWYSLISSPYFVESHSKHINDPELTQRITGKGCFIENSLLVVGSANGLVCVSPEGFQFLVVNPCTKQAIKILEPPPEPYSKDDDRRWERFVWGFGYDSFNNDYKIIVGSVMEFSTRFYVLSLKTCVWKFIIKYGYLCTNSDNLSGILCDGELRWLTMNYETKELAIFSFDLSREEFISIRLPEGHSVYQRGTRYILGLMEGSLCLYVVRPPSTKIWVLKSDTESYWELLPDNYYAMKYEAVYHMNEDDYSIPDSPKLLNSGKYIGAPMYARSLVSPYYHVNHMDSSSKTIVISMAKKNVIIRRVRRILKRHGLFLLFYTYVLCLFVVAILIAPNVNQRINR